MQKGNRNVMNAIKMKRLELLDIVRVNKETHIKAYAEAVTDYKQLVVKVAAQNVDIAKTDSIIKHFNYWPTTPISYEDSYKRAIRMLELSIEDVIEVEEDVFNQLVLDEWSWKSQFVGSTTSYKTGLGG
jgi:predicted nucleic acid-binding OB-fold protein